MDLSENKAGRQDVIRCCALPDAGLATFVRIGPRLDLLIEHAGCSGARPSNRLLGTGQWNGGHYHQSQERSSCFRICGWGSVVLRSVSHRLL